MTAEELKLLENLMNEIQELNRILTISVAVKYAENHEIRQSSKT